MAGTFEDYCNGINPDTKTDTNADPARLRLAHKWICRSQQDPVNLSEFRDIKFKSATKEITGKSGKTYTVPTISIPAGTFLYRGVQSKPTTNTIPPTGLWVSWVNLTSSGYHKYSIELDLTDDDKGKKYLGVLTFEVQRDLELLDLWTPAAWSAILSEAPEHAEKLKALAGTERVSDKKGMAYLARSKGPDMFPRSTCEDTECQTILWRGLPWGPDKGSYKRKSQQDIDLDAIEIIYGALPSGFDGIFALPTPSDSNKYPGLTPPMFGVFHEEMNIRPGREDALLYKEKRVSGGKKTRRKHKKSKRTRTSKKK